MALIIKADGSREERMDIDDLSILQGIVDGPIELARCNNPAWSGVICNEEGKLIDLPLNMEATELAGYTHDVLCGTVIFLSEGEVT